MSTPVRMPSQWNFDEPAFLAKIPYPVTRTTMEGVFSANAPPDSFNPNTASETDLIKNGILWRRPTATDNPALKQAWDKVFSRKWLAADRIIPIMEPQVGRKRVLNKTSKKATNGTYLFPGWSGAVATTGAPFTGAIGYWYVPTVSKAPESPSSPPSYDSTIGVAYDSSSWIGLDGFLVTNDVLQAGIEQSIDTKGNPHYVAWYEWYGPIGPPPAYVDQVNITNLPISPGNEIYVSVQYVGKTGGSIYLGNVTTGKHFSITIAPPSGASFSGNSAEWIMEDPDGGEATNTSLARFTPVTFTSALACSASGTVYNPESQNICNIQANNGKVLTSTTVGQNTATISFTG